MAWNTQDEKNYIEMMESRFELEGRSPLPFLKNYLKQQSIWEYAEAHSGENDIDAPELRAFVYARIREYEGRK